MPGVITCDEPFTGRWGDGMAAGQLELLRTGPKIAAEHTSTKLYQFCGSTENGATSVYFVSTLTAVCFGLSRFPSRVF